MRPIRHHHVMSHMENSLSRFCNRHERAAPAARVRKNMSAWVNPAHHPDVRPAGVSSGQYRQTSEVYTRPEYWQPLVHSQPTAVEREQAHAKILSATARTGVPYPAPALDLNSVAASHLPLRLQVSPLDSDPARYHGSGWTGYVSKYGATASRKGLNCNPDPPAEC